MGPDNGAVPERIAGVASVELRAIELAGIPMQIGPHPQNPDLKAIILGPLYLAIPLDGEASRQVVQGLTGVVIASEQPPTLGRE